MKFRWSKIIWKAKKKFGQSRWHGHLLDCVFFLHKIHLIVTKFWNFWDALFWQNEKNICIRLGFFLNIYLKMLTKFWNFLDALFLKNVFSMKT